MWRMNAKLRSHFQLLVTSIFFLFFLFFFPFFSSPTPVPCYLPPFSCCILRTLLLAACLSPATLSFISCSLLPACCSHLSIFLASYLQFPISFLLPYCFLGPVPLFRASCLIPDQYPADCCITVSTVKFINSHFCLWQAWRFVHIEILFDFVATFPHPRMYLKSLCDKVAGTGSMPGGSIRSMIWEITDEVHKRGFSSMHLPHF